MNDLIKKSDNIFLKFWTWLKKKFFNKNKQLNDDKKIEILNTTDIADVQIQNQDNINNYNNEKKYVYVQDLLYETEKSNMVSLAKEVLEHKKDVKDFELADIIRLKQLLED